MQNFWEVIEYEKDALKALLADNSPTAVMNAFMRYRRKVSEGRCEDPDPITATIP